MSIHIGARTGEIAEKVLLPGDPLRARYIAEHFLEDPVLYSKVRGMYGYTGTYKGKRVSVQGTGMGIPSISIYVNELLAYGAKTLIRVGTCGSMREDLKIRDLFIALAAATDSAVNAGRFPGFSYAPIADFSLASAAAREAEKEGLRFMAGECLSSDLFYDPRMDEKREAAVKAGICACEMESAELYTLAALGGAKALALFTVSDSMVTGEELSSSEREETLGAMIRLALEIV